LFKLYHYRLSGCRKHISTQNKAWENKDFTATWTVKMAHISIGTEADRIKKETNI